MDFSQWKPVWDQAMAAFAHEPIAMRIGIGLSLAFLALMVLEGLRASFIPARKTSAPPAQIPESPAPALELQPAATSESLAQIEPAPRSLVQTRHALLHNRKREAASPRPQRSMRPKIRRVVGTIHDERRPS